MYQIKYIKIIKFTNECITDFVTDSDEGKTVA